MSAVTLPARGNARSRVRARRSRILRFTACLFAAMVLAAALSSGASSAAVAVLTVTNTNDSGVGSLRQAVADAAPGDTINFSLPSGSVITLTSQELVLDKNLAVSGPGADSLAVSGNGQRRVLRVASGVAASISGLTIRDGSVVPPGFNTNNNDGNGGGVLNAGTLALSDCVVTNNTVSGSITPAGNGNGGGIDNSGALTLTNCTVNNNRALGGNNFLDAGFANGGGIHNRAGATLAVTNSTLNGNEARGGRSNQGAARPGSGGGIFNAGTLTLNGSSVNGNAAVGRGVPETNAAGGFGGGLDNSGTANVSGCDFANNTARGGFSVRFGGPADGGGINNREGATLTLTNSSVRDNTALAAGGTQIGAPAAGGGIKNLSTATLTNSTVSDNTATGGSVASFGGATGEGGGLYSVGTLTLTNSTVSGNEARGGWGASNNAAGKGAGGGIFAEGTLTLTNCTVTLNGAAGGRGQTSSAEGGGILFRGSGTAKPINTIVAGNAARGNSNGGGANDTANGPDVSGTFATLGHNLVGKNDGAEASFPAGRPNVFADIVGTSAAPVDAVLGPLADNGGPTRTHRPWRDSPAVESGDNAVLGPPYNLTTDQRGPGFPRLVHGRVNMGSVETTFVSTFEFEARTLTVDEGAGGYVVTVKRTGNLDGGDTSVDFESYEGRASPRTDYAAAYGTLHFALGETTKTFIVFINDDAFVEEDESLTLHLKNEKGGPSTNASSTTVLTIKDNDATPPASNPIDGTQFFVRQHYVEFLGRVADAEGLQFWTNQIESCGADAQCREVKRINVSAAFFQSIEFKETSFFALRARRVAFGKRSAGATARVSLVDFLYDSRQLGEGVVVGQGLWQEMIKENKLAYLRSLVNSELYRALYPETQAPAQHVDALFASAGVTPTAAERAAALDAYGWGGTSGRAAALQSVAESTSLTNAETNPAFVLSEYFGYLRRNPTAFPDSDDTGYQFWLTKLNQFNGNYIAAEMVRAFISSLEYRRRFGPQ
ncbi:MAG TPA: Calx-beta domain-containing protein [Pyrinomonadaceae bacterium]